VFITCSRFISGQELFWFAIGDASVEEGHHIKAIVWTDGPETVEEFLVMRTGESGAARALPEMADVLGFFPRSVRAFGLECVPCGFFAAVAPIFFGAADGVVIGALGEGLGREVVNAGRA
jgi:hypothetical protein